MKQIAYSALRREVSGASGRRSGFTLVELLTVIAIIGMLSAISITTVRASIQSAKETQTRTTIAKIDNVLTACYEKYQYRRVDLDSLLSRTGINNQYSNSPRVRASYRLQIMRDLLRCDFPCTPDELDQQSNYNYSSSSVYTPLQNAIRMAANGNLSPKDFTDEEYPENSFPTEHGGYPHIANAELLYLVVMNADPEARATFSDREVGDVDGNGLYEFHDGWGKPICWMRWAPGLESSDRQPLEEDMLDVLGAGGVIDSIDRDPFDPLNVGVSNGSSTAYGWFLVPYIFSAGPDEKYGVIMPNPTTVAEMNNPFVDPQLDNGLSYQDYADKYNLSGRFTKTHKDNIDNHTLVR